MLRLFSFSFPSSLPPLYLFLSVRSSVRSSFRQSCLLFSISLLFLNYPTWCRISFFISFSMLWIFLLWFILVVQRGAVCSGSTPWCTDNVNTMSTLAAYILCYSPVDNAVGPVGDPLACNCEWKACLRKPFHSFQPCRYISRPFLSETNPLVK